MKATCGISSEKAIMCSVFENVLQVIMDTDCF